MLRSRVALLRVLIPLFMIVGCSDKNGNSTGIPSPDWDSVTGAIRRIDDAVPMDGGVDLELELDGGQTERAFLPSLFTVPPAPQEQWDIYSQIVGLKIGDRVTVEGERTEHGIRIEKLTVLTNESRRDPLISQCSHSLRGGVGWGLEACRWS